MQGCSCGGLETNRRVFGHEDVAVDFQVVASSGLLEGLFEGGVSARVGEVRLAAVAAEGYEVEIAFVLVAL